MKAKFVTFSLKHKRALLIGLAVVCGVLLLAQLLYPRDRMLPFENIDGLRVDKWSKQDAIKELDKKSNEQKVSVKVASDDEVRLAVKPSEFGLTVKNEERVEQANYPVWLRLVPTSLLWASATTSFDEPSYERSEEKLKTFVAKQFGKDCVVQPTNATVVAKDGKLTVTPAKDGGRCKTSEIIKDFMNAKPTITGERTVTVEVEPIAADVTTKAATKFKDEITARVKRGVTVSVLGADVVIPAAEVTNWVVTKPNGKELMVSLDAAKSDAYFAKDIAKKVAIAPGTTRVTMKDFTETSRQNGASGRALDTANTRLSVESVVRGTAAKASAATLAVPANVEYSYSYSKTKEGISALMKNYDTEHAGTFGAMLIELNGSGVAQWQSDKVFITASTYKLFVAYGTLRKVEAGQWHWNDANISAGRNLSTCFDDMIVKSDNACAETLLKKLGFSWLTNELKAVGLTKSSFLHDDPETTAADLALFLVKLEKGGLSINTDSRNRLKSAMSRQIFRQGIPAGASGAVSDKVGFLNGLLHDAAIVYSPKGTYVLVIMSDGASWGNIAELTREIEKLR